MPGSIVTEMFKPFNNQQTECHFSVPAAPFYKNLLGWTLKVTAMDVTEEMALLVLLPQ